MEDIKKNAVITFRTDEITKAKLQAIANKRKWSISQLIDDIIEKNINAENNALKELAILDDTYLPCNENISKSNGETIYHIANILNCSYETALNFIIAHIALEWPFYGEKYNDFF